MSKQPTTDKQPSHYDRFKGLAKKVLSTSNERYRQDEDVRKATKTKAKDRSEKT